MRYLSMLALAASFPALGQVGNLQISTGVLSFSAVSGSTVPQSQNVGVSSTGAPLPLNVSVRYFTATEGWLSASADSTATPSNVTVTVSSGALAPGVYSGQVLIVASGTQSGLITVTLTVAGSNPGSGAITASPASVSLASSNGQIVQSTVALSSTALVPFQVFVTVNGSWLSYVAASTTAPTSITISANPAGLAPGVYTGSVSIAPSMGGLGTIIPVTFTVGAGGAGGGFGVSPNSLNFIYQTGTANPAPQSTFVNNTSGIVSYVASSNSPWAQLTSSNNSAPAQTVTGTSNTNLTVVVDPTGLTPGVYNATVTVTASNAASQTVAVTLTVSGNSLLAASPSAFAFTYSPDSGVPSSQQATITATGGTPVSFTASASSSGWLLVGPQTGSTGGSNVLTISVNPIGLAAGAYTGSINVSSGLTSLSILVTLNVGTTAANSIGVSPSQLNFQSQFGGPSASQTLFLTAVSAKNFLVSVSAMGGNWLQASPNSGVTPASLTVTITPLAVSQAGTYNGVVQISNLSDGTQLSVPVTMTVSGAALTVSPQTISLSLTAGSATAAVQAIQVSGTANSTFTASSDSVWLTASPATGSVPGNFNISISAARLTPGSYAGIVTVSGSGVTAAIPVALSVTNSTAPVLTPSNLTFQYTPGAAPPAAQIVAVSSATGTTSFTVSSTTLSGGEWLSVAASGSTTPATLTVSTLPSGLAAGTYRGMITVAGTDVRTAEVTLVVTAPAGPTLRTALHGATRELSAITPGMILSLQGAALGPIAGVSGSITAAGAFETTLNGFRVLFDGVPAPILYSAANRMDVVAPYAITGRVSSRVQVENAGTRSDAIELIVSRDAAPGIFSSDGSGRGQAAALNENGTGNSASNPASRTGVLVFYATGEGQTRPGGQDGRIIATDLRVPVLPVAVNIGGVAVEVLYAGSAPNSVSGLMQVNVRLSADVPRGSAVALELRVGPAPSPPGVTVAVQ